MPSYKEKVIIEYFGNDNYHIYSEDDIEKFGIKAVDVDKLIYEWTKTNLKIEIAEMKSRIKQMENDTSKR